MKTVLFNTSTMWNCGDDFIREGVINLLDLPDTISTIWWNRAFGVTAEFANDIACNVALSDYFVVAGTPQWLMLSEGIYERFIETRRPVAIIGVGTSDLRTHRQRNLLKKLALSGVCEIALARDEAALGILQEAGFTQAEWMIDPAFFLKPILAEQNLTILGWRDLSLATHDPRMAFRHPVKWARMQQLRFVSARQRKLQTQEYDVLMQRAFGRLPEPKLVVVHDNREVARARELFGHDSVFYSSDYHAIWRIYSRCLRYLGSRLHGAIPALVHGAAVHLVYQDMRWAGFWKAIQSLRADLPQLEKAVRCTVVGRDELELDLKLEGVGRDPMRRAIELQKQRVLSTLSRAPTLTALRDYRLVT
jgi:hypothetical protein